MREELVPVSHNRCSVKTYRKILNVIVADKAKENDFQDARNMVKLGIVSDIRHYDEQLEEVDKQLEEMLSYAGLYSYNYSRGKYHHSSKDTG
ncbi:MAG: hypothetical protein HFI34_06540 [Lachnospiraceae bacterium]|nr:hypothetical protein [Lachnospiraceae bacterium]